jgi:undecaprenyl-diphosphatase
MTTRPTSQAARAAPWAPALLLAAPAILWLGALGVGAGADGRPGEIDTAGMALAARAHAPAADAFFRAVTWAGSILVLAPLAIAHAAFAWYRLRNPGAFFVPVVLAGAALLAFAAKIAVDRARPDIPALIDMPGDASFPSAHTLQAGAFALAWLLAPGRGKPPHRGEIALTVLLVALVAWSRLHLQVHYPSDILFGLAAALVWVLGLRCLPIWSKTT